MIYFGIALALLAILSAGGVLARQFFVKDNVVELNEALIQTHMQMDQAFLQYQDWAKAHNEWAAVTRSDGPDRYDARRPGLRAEAMSELNQLIGQLGRCKRAAERAAKELSKRP